MSSLHDTYKVIVAGDEICGYSLCLRLCDKSISDPHFTARESLSRDWPRDEWTKFYTLSRAGEISTVELDLELHGPWVWELYNVMEPMDYFRRFDGAVICGNPRRPDSLGIISSLYESIDNYTTGKVPTLIFVDLGNDLRQSDAQEFRELAMKLDVDFRAFDMMIDESVEELFKTLATTIHASQEK